MAKKQKLRVGSTKAPYTYKPTAEREEAKCGIKEFKADMVLSDDDFIVLDGKTYIVTDSGAEGFDCVYIGLKLFQPDLLSGYDVVLDS